MTTTANRSYAFAAQQIAIYFGFPVLITGILGGIFNLIVFLSLQTFRQNSCALFLTFMSFVNIGQLITGLLSRIMLTGFNVDWTDQSLFYCKFRAYCLQICTLISSTCMCLATIDQYMATSFRLRWRQMINIQKARLICILMSLFWLIHSIPALIWYNLSYSTHTGQINCVQTSVGYQNYYTYVYILILTGILPMIITIILGSLAYWNVRQIPYRTVPLVRRELDKQLTSMVLVQIILTVIIFLLYTITSVLSSILTDVGNVNFCNFVAIMIYYLYFANPFYIYFYVSKRFRQQFFYVIFSIYFKQENDQTAAINQITPEVNEQQQQQR